MLTRIFATSKPLNYLLVGGYVFVVMILQLVFDATTVFDLTLLLTASVGFAAIFFSILLLDFIVRKNSLSKQNTYIVLIYGCLLAFLPLVDLFFVLIAAQILLFLGIRRAISLRSNKRTIKKIFDAAFWIAIASLIYFWSWVYIIALYAAVLYFSKQNYRYWLLPLFGLILVALLYVTGYFVIFDKFPLWESIFVSPDLDFNSWLKGNDVLVPAIFIGLSIIGGLLFYIRLSKTLFKLKRVQLYCILMLFIVGIAAIFGPKTQPQTWILMTFPLSVVAGNVVQDNTQRIITEVLLWGLVASPIVLAILL
jgi:hypothetical protein